MEKKRNLWSEKLSHQKITPAPLREEQQKQKQKQKAINHIPSQNCPTYSALSDWLLFKLGGQ